MTTETQTYATTAAEARTSNKDIAEKSGSPYVKVAGNTFPVRKVLWTMGGDWNRDEKCYFVPAHQAVEAQALVDRITAKIAENMATAKAKREAKEALAKAEIEAPKV